MIQHHTYHIIMQYVDYSYPSRFCVCILGVRSRFRVFPFLWLPDTHLTNKSLRSIKICTVHIPYFTCCFLLLGHASILYKTYAYD